MIKECHGIRLLRTVAAFGRNNAAYKAAHLISISLFVIKSAPILVTRTEVICISYSSSSSSGGGGKGGGRGGVNVCNLDRLLKHMW